MDITVASNLITHSATSTDPGGIVQVLQSQLSGVVPVLYPAGLAIALLFGGYYLIKGWYHRTF